MNTHFFLVCFNYLYWFDSLLAAPSLSFVKLNLLSLYQTHLPARDCCSHWLELLQDCSGQSRDGWWVWEEGELSSTELFSYITAFTWIVGFLWLHPAVLRRQLSINTLTSFVEASESNWQILACHFYDLFWNYFLSEQLWGWQCEGITYV